MKAIILDALTRALTLIPDHDSHLEYGEGPDSECDRCRIEHAFALVSQGPTTPGPRAPVVVLHAYDVETGCAHWCSACRIERMLAREKKL